MFNKNQLETIKSILDNRETAYPKEHESISRSVNEIYKIINKILILSKPDRGFKVLLVPRLLDVKNYSIEAGVCDGEDDAPTGVRHFDHHDGNSDQPCPAINKEIPSISIHGSIIEISHIDCDTYLGMLRMTALSLLPDKIDLDMIAELDKNGTSKIIRTMAEENYCKYIVSNIERERTLFYFVGVGELAKSLNFPRVTSEPQDVTQIILDMRDTNKDKIIEMGRKAVKKGEETYLDCCKASTFDTGNKEMTIEEGPKTGYWVIGPDNSFDCSRPYLDGVEIVIVFRKHWKTISIYCNPTSKYEFGGKTIAGIKFEGHPKACGSPRGQKMTEKDGIRVFNTII